MRGCEPSGNCIVSTFLCPDYVICRPVYKSDPLYGLDLSLLLKGLTLQRVHPGSPIAGLHPRTDSDSNPPQYGYHWKAGSEENLVIVVVWHDSTHRQHKVGNIQFRPLSHDVSKYLGKISPVFLAVKQWICGRGTYYMMWILYMSKYSYLTCFISSEINS